MNDFFQGMMYLFLGARHLLTDGLKRFIVLPIIFNFLLFLSVFYLIYHYLFPYSAQYFAMLPAWLHFLQSLLLVFFIITFFLTFLSFFTIFFNLIAAPFNGLLAEKAQNILYGSPIPPLSFSTIAWRSIKRQSQFLGYFFPRFVIICLLFFVPFIQPIYPFLWFIFNAWMLSLQYQDFAMDNNLIDFKNTREKMNENKMLSLGFGSLINLASFIPLLNIFTMPAAVIGAVMLYCDTNAKVLIRHKTSK